MAAYNNIFKIKHNNPLPAKGSLLISEPFLQNAYFQRSVVLLIEHNADGSMGFVLNKKTNLIINDFFPEFENLSDIPIYLGGPVSSNRLFFIHTLEEVIPDSIKITDGLYFDGNFDKLKQYIVNGNSIKGKVKFFLGYSGWTKGQLGFEIKEDSWMVSRSANSNIMLADGELFWKRSLEVLGNQFKAWINFPKDPHLN
ncbi:MAG: YqgE/AlgH family protein [Tannerellaceae bacterium]|jgi:putative transcriptional regulator|nr:YqgE/AlgH family protein [Tannerellaceae bacterium]